MRTSSNFGHLVVHFAKYETGEICDVVLRVQVTEDQFAQ